MRVVHVTEYRMASSLLGVRISKEVLCTRSFLSRRWFVSEYRPTGDSA
jgi:hypothetical protein